MRTLEIILFIVLFGIATGVVGFIVQAILERLTKPSPPRPIYITPPSSIERARVCSCCPVHGLPTAQAEER